MLHDLYDYRAMIANLVKRDLVGRYKKSVLGFLWSFIDPLLQLLIYTILFTKIMPVIDIPYFHLHLFVALVPWLFFASCLTGGCMSVIGQQDMLKKIYFPREVLPVAFVTAQFINMLMSFIMVFAVLIITGYGISIMCILFFPIVLIMQYMLALGITFVASAVTVYFRDMQQILNALSLVLMYASPVIYALQYVPQEYRFLYMMNPITRVIVAYRDILYFKQVPELSNMLIGSVECFLALVIGAVIFRKMSKRFAEEL